MVLNLLQLRRDLLSGDCRPGRFLAALALALAGTTALAADRITDAPFATRSEVLAPRAMAATSQPLAAQIALDVMKAGGNANDARSPPTPRSA